MAWTPYLVICYFGLFKIEGLTPLTTIWGATFAKTSAVYNPIVYGIRYVVSENIKLLTKTLFFCV